MPRSIRLSVFLGLALTWTACNRTTAGGTAEPQLPQAVGDPGDVDVVVAELERVIEAPASDPEGTRRVELVETLIRLRHPRAVPLLIRLLEQPQERQPVVVHRAAAQALIPLGDPRATEALLLVPFRVPDVPSTTDVSNRAKLALVGIGEPAVPTLRRALLGEHEELNALAAKHGINPLIVKQSTAGILGAMGARSVVNDVIAIFPKEGCRADAPPSDPARVGLRAFIARTLALMGDPAAVEPLCLCATASRSPSDMWEIARALGWIGGPRAVECLTRTIAKGEYDLKHVAAKKFRYESRWEAVRFAGLAAGANARAIRSAMKKNRAVEVRKNFAQYERGLKTIERCKDDLACYLQVLGDPNEDWYAREVSATHAARLAPGDRQVAFRIAQAFSVRNADARATIAHLIPAMLGNKGCRECARALQSVLDAEHGTMSATMQLPVMLARESIVKLTASWAEHGTDRSDGSP